VRLPPGAGLDDVSERVEGPSTADVSIDVADTLADLQQLAAVFDEIWGTTCPVVRVELLRAVQHAGGYLSVLEQGGRVVGGSFGILARHRGEPALHSHVTGVLPAVRRTGAGRAVKLHQRAWAADHGLAWIVWTFDPLVRRNAWFNLGVLGARVEEYLVDFYGPIEDAVNARDETDRLLVAWAVDDSRAVSSARPDGETIEVATPDDIVALRGTDPEAAAHWRRRLRTELAGALAAGGEVVGFTRDGAYVVRR
jgi:predicted GNAT superfamily acetyltransferase